MHAYVDSNFLIVEKDNRVVAPHSADNLFFL